jgi:hypothetical protein
MRHRNAKRSVWDSYKYKLNKRQLISLILYLFVYNHTKAMCYEINYYKKC